MSENKEMKNKENKKEKGAKSSVDRRALSLKVFSVTSVVIILVIVLLINVVFDKIIGKKLEFDFTSTEQNSVSEMTVDYIKSLPDDTHIRIVGLMDRPEDYRGTEYEYIVPLLDDYQKQSGGKITVEYIDPEKHPSITKELDPKGVYDLQSNIFALSCNGHVETVVPLYCYNYNQEMLNYGQYVPTANNVESTFTNAIVNLTRGYTHKAYIVSGLDNHDDSQLQTILNALGFEVAENPASDSFTVPEDCDLLYLNNIDKDITESMYLAMDDYLQNTHGNLIVSAGFTQYNSTESFDNLNLLLNKFNIAISDEVLMENDPSYIMDANAGSYYAELGGNYGGFTTNNEKIKYASARPITTSDFNRQWITQYPVLLTSSSATTYAFDENGTPVVHNNKNQFDLGLFSTYTDVGDKAPQVYVFGITTLTDDAYIGSFGLSDANAVFIRNIIRSMFGIENSIDIPSRPLANYSINSDKVNQKTVSGIIFIFMVVIPLAFVITGVVIYKKRKNL